MKRIIVLLSAVVATFCSPLYAQMVIQVLNPNDVLKAKPIDDVLFTVQYQTTFIHDTVKPESRQEETMMLKVGKKASQYYSYAKYLTDSIIEVDKANGASQETIIAHLRQYSPKVTAQVLKNYPSGKVTTLDRLAMSNFKCVEDMEQPKWQILADTMTILTYPCRKAVTSFRGRDYEAWFTTEIARSEGPWKLGGLPGLILKAKDSRGYYTFDCTGLTMNHSAENIMYVGDDCEPISRKELNKLYERFAADPVGFITSSAPNVQIQIRNSEGQPTKNPKNMPFNPIELAEK